MALTWLKLHTTLLDDPKFFALRGDDLRFWLVCLLVYMRDGSIPDAKRLGFMARIEEPEECIESLVHLQLLDRADDGTLTPHDWLEWQSSPKLKSSNAERQARFRENKKRARNGLAPVTRDTPLRNGQSVTVTSPVTKMEMETETKTEIPSASQLSAARAREEPEANRWDALEAALKSVIPPLARTWPIHDGRWQGSVLIPALGLGDIQKLIDQGYSLEEHIKPSVREQIDKRLKAMKERPETPTLGDWRYFCKGIVDYRQKADAASHKPKTDVDIAFEQSAARRERERQMAIEARTTPSQEEQNRRLRVWLETGGSGWNRDRWGDGPMDAHLDATSGYNPLLLASLGFASDKFPSQQAVEAYRVENVYPEAVKTWIKHQVWDDLNLGAPPDKAPEDSPIRALWNELRTDAQGRRIAPARVVTRASIPPG